MVCVFKLFGLTTVLDSDLELTCSQGALCSFLVCPYSKARTSAPGRPPAERPQLWGVAQRQRLHRGGHARDRGRGPLEPGEPYAFPKKARYYEYVHTAEPRTTIDPRLVRLTLPVRGYTHAFRRGSQKSSVR